METSSEIESTDAFRVKTPSVVSTANVVALHEREDAS